MLVGTTFAWFSDSASNKGNVIASGNLGITVIGFDSAGKNPIDFSAPEASALISEGN